MAMNRGLAAWQGVGLARSPDQEIGLGFERFAVSAEDGARFDGHLSCKSGFWIFSCAAMLIETLKQAKRIIVAIVGFTLVTLGVAMFVTPGPGWATIFLGLTVLSAEFVWARRLLKRLKKTGSQVASTIIGALNGHSPAPAGNSPHPASAADREHPLT